MKKVVYSLTRFAINIENVDKQERTVLFVTVLFAYLRIIKYQLIHLI